MYIAISTCCRLGEGLPFTKISNVHAKSQLQHPAPSLWGKAATCCGGVNRFKTAGNNSVANMLLGNKLLPDQLQTESLACNTVVKMVHTL